MTVDNLRAQVRLMEQRRQELLRAYDRGTGDDVEQATKALDEAVIRCILKERQLQAQDDLEAEEEAAKVAEHKEADHCEEAGR